MKLSLEMIYNREQSTKQSRLGFWIDSVSELKEERKRFCSNIRQGVSRVKRKRLFSRGWIRECFIEVDIDNGSKIIFVNLYRKMIFVILFHFIKTEQKHFILLLT